MIISAHESSNLPGTDNFLLVHAMHTNSFGPTGFVNIPECEIIALVSCMPVYFASTAEFGTSRNTFHKFVFLPKTPVSKWKLP